MSFTTTQKIIKIGDSLAVTIPAKDARNLQLHKGDDIQVTFKLVAQKQDPIDAAYEKFKEQYGETLKNLADR